MLMRRHQQAATLFAAVQAEPSRYLPSEYVTVDTGLQSLLREGLVQRGEAQVQVRRPAWEESCHCCRPHSSLARQC